MDNQELVEKTLTTSNMTNGGALNNKQQSRFLELIRSYGSLLPRVRFIRMTQANQDIDKLHLGEPVTRPAGENAAYPMNGTTPFAAWGTAPNYPWKTVPKFNKITLAARKVRSDWALTTESLQENIAGNNLEASVMGAIAERMSHDMEEMAINGDTSTTISGLSADAPLAFLRYSLNGWDKLADEAMILDVNGAYVSKQVFGDMIRIQAKEYRSDPGMVFIASDNVSQDWQEMLAERVGSVGDSALQGGGIAPYGKPLLRNSIFRDDRDLVTAPNQAQIVGGNFGPFTFTTTQHVLGIECGTTDNTGDYWISFPPGTWDTNQVITLLTPADGWGGTAVYSKSVYIGTTAYKSWFYSADADAITDNESTNTQALSTNFRAAELRDGRIVLYNATAGAGNDIQVDSDGTEANDVSHILGFHEYARTAGDLGDDGEASGATQMEGSNIWLVNPRNLIWGVLDGTRIFTEYNKDSDVIESVIYNQVAASIENTRAMVKAINVRGQTGWPS